MKLAPSSHSRAKPVVFFHGHTIHEDGRRSVTLSVDGQRWQYDLTSPQCDTVEYLCKRISARKALNYARSRSTRQVKI
jgi:hypothetical protein